MVWEQGTGNKANDPWTTFCYNSPEAPGLGWVTKTSCQQPEIIENHLGYSHPFLNFISRSHWTRATIVARGDALMAYHPSEKNVTLTWWSALSGSRHRTEQRFWTWYVTRSGTSGSTVGCSTIGVLWVWESCLTQGDSDSQWAEGVFRSVFFFWIYVISPFHTISDVFRFIFTTLL